MANIALYTHDIDRFKVIGELEIVKLLFIQTKVSNSIVMEKINEIFPLGSK